MKCFCCGSLDAERVARRVGSRKVFLPLCDQCKRFGDWYLDWCNKTRPPPPTPDFFDYDSDFDEDNTSLYDW